MERVRARAKLNVHSGFTRREMVHLTFFTPLDQGWPSSALGLGVESCLASLYRRSRMSLYTSLPVSLGIHCEFLTPLLFDSYLFVIGDHHYLWNSGYDI
jgi:hypothetical protein